MARPTFSAEELALIDGLDDETVVAELNAEDLAIERGMLANGLTHAEIAKLRGKAPDDVAKAPVTPQSIARELAAIDKYRRENRHAYNNDFALQERERQLLQAQRQRGVESREVATKDDDGGLPAELLDEWASQAGIEHHLGLVHRTTQSMLEALDEPEAANLQQSFDALPEGAQLQVYRFLAVDGGTFPRASEDELADFSETDGAAEVLESWGRDAAKKLGVVRGRVALMVSGMSAQDREKFGDFLDNLSGPAAAAVFKAIAG